MTYTDTTLDIMEATDIELQGILSGTVPISPSLTVTEAMAAHTTAAYAQIYAQPYPNQQQALLDAVDVAERFYSELQGQELELQQELRELLAGDAIGVLASGFAEATLSALDFVNLPATLISPWPAIDEFRGRPAPYFAPGLAPRVVVVPSGALHAIANSPGARGWLDAYAAGGGRLIVFTQAFGSDWSALPGGQVAGVGYEEDQRWQHATVEAGMPSDWLVWMGIAKPDVQIDGAFTAWPTGANILLRRTFGALAGSPVLIEYPYGAGSVLATTAYGDWAWQTNFWWGDDARMTHSLLMRAYLLSQGQDVANVFAADPASSVTVSFPIRNTSAFNTTSVEVVLPVRLGYWGQDYRAQVPLELAPGATGQVVATLSTPPVMRGVHDWTQVGLYHLNVTVKGASGLQYGVPGPFVYVRSPVLPPPLAGSLQTASSPVNLFQTVPVSATVRNYSAVACTVVISPVRDLPLDLVTLAVPAQSTATHVYSILANGSKAPVAEFYDEANRLIGRASRTIQVALPDLRARPVVPSDMSDGALLPVVLTNKAAQGQALDASLALSLTIPSGATLWTGNLDLPPLAAGQTVTPTFTIAGSDNELGTYRLNTRVDDGRGLARTSFTPIPSRLTVAARLDRSTVRIRESGTMTVTLANTGQFDLSATLTVSSPALGLSGNQPFDLPVGAQEAASYAFTVPDTLPAGSHRIDVSYDVAGQMATQALYVVVPPAQVVPMLDVTSYAAGDTIAVTLLNRGGVDAPFTAELSLADRYGVTVASATPAGTVLAGGELELTLAIPAGAVSGDYVVRLAGNDTAADQAFGLHREVAVTGVEGGLVVRTDLPSYFADQDITALATLTASGAPIVNGTVDLKICTPVLAEEDPGETSASRVLQTIMQNPPQPVLGSSDPLWTRASSRPKRTHTAAVETSRPGDLHPHHRRSVDDQRRQRRQLPGDLRHRYWRTGPGLLDRRQHGRRGHLPLVRRLRDRAGLRQSPRLLGHALLQSMGNGWPGGRCRQRHARRPVDRRDRSRPHAQRRSADDTRNSYVDGDNFFRLDWDICLPQPAQSRPSWRPTTTCRAATTVMGCTMLSQARWAATTERRTGSRSSRRSGRRRTYYEAGYSQVWNAIGSGGLARTRLQRHHLAQLHRQRRGPAVGPVRQRLHHGERVLELRRDAYHPAGRAALPGHLRLRPVGGNAPGLHRHLDLALGAGRHPGRYGPPAPLGSCQQQHGPALRLPASTPSTSTTAIPP